MYQRGFTMVEMAVTVAILAVLLLGGASFALGMRPMAMRSAAAQFEAQFHAARSLAAASGGATIVVQLKADPGKPGFTSIVYARRPMPGATLTVSGIPPVTSDSDIRERALGAPAFAIFISSAGHVSIEPQYPAIFDTPNLPALGREPACPAAGFYTLEFSSGGATENMPLPCRIAVAGTPMPLVTNPPAPATPAATPTP
ncbi:MAG: prepilin-type N-terminal cleavage/methylation domain-containing protein [Candidatus Eremiobacteraeota bacterium]|nr:prepilin-type N-terminal cleavage/methylation domain-containing protein [Candidatus Eremiobacteraeota bacterium]